MVNKKELDIQRQESFWLLSGTHMLIFLWISIATSCFAIVIPLNRPFKRFFKTFYDR